MVLTQARVNLAATGIHRYHAGSAALQQAIGETSRGSTNVETHSPAYIDSPIIESSFQFEPAPARILQLVTEKSYRAVLIHCRARIMAWARSREFASPRATSKVSSLTFRFFSTTMPTKFLMPLLPPKCQQPRLCKVLNLVTLKELQSYLPAFPHNLAPLC